MRLFEVAEIPGTYVGARFDEDTKTAVADFQDGASIPNALDPEKLHVTIAYSRVELPDFEVQDQVDWNGTFEAFDIFPGEDGTRCLVLLFTCPELSAEWQKAMDMGATWDYDGYHPHITLSYDVGDFDITKLPDYDGPIRIVEEYKEPLKLEWAKDESE